MGVNFFSRKIGHEGGGGGPTASCLWMQKIPIFIFEYFPNALFCNVSDDDITMLHLHCLTLLHVLNPNDTKMEIDSVMAIRFCAFFLSAAVKVICRNVYSYLLHRPLLVGRAMLQNESYVTAARRGRRGTAAVAVSTVSSSGLSWASCA